MSEYVNQLICINRSLSDCEIKDHELEKTWICLVKVKVAQSCPTLCNPYTVHGILQARILEWVAFPFSRGSSQSRDQQSNKTILFYFTQNSVSEFLFGTCEPRQSFSNITYLSPGTHSYVHRRQQEMINSKQFTLPQMH